MADIYQRGETDEIFGWDPAGNNNFIYSGKGSMIFNAISATRTPEDRKPAVRERPLDLADPEGPARPAGLPARDGLLVDLEVRAEQGGGEEVPRRPGDQLQGRLPGVEVLQLPELPGRDAVQQDPEGGRRSDKHRPLGKYGILTTIAQKYTTNPGHPGYANAAFGEMFSKFLIPKMFAQVSQKKMTAQEAVNAADREIKSIYAKWRKLEEDLRVVNAGTVPRTCPGDCPLVGFPDVV